MSRVLLNMADLLLRSRANGPGVRSVAWVQGCALACAGCGNPHTHAHERKHLVDPVELGRRLAAVPETDGITLSGGEPFEQAKACALLAETVREAGRSVMVFSGYPYKVLQESSESAVQRFLATIDLLIAGPYVAARKHDGSLWRASTNQTIHALTDRLAHAVNEPSDTYPIVEITLDGKDLITTGFPNEQEHQWLDELLISLNPRAP
ncbi:MAG: hypothetical protein CL908_21045 [Deltaproteobacteria bacterium]|nr:hypothetical protein [Deltaproteobacteria bacterium]